MGAVDEGVGRVGAGWEGQDGSRLHGRVLVRCVAGRMRDVNQMLGVGWW